MPFTVKSDVRRLAMMLIALLCFGMALLVGSVRVQANGHTRTVDASQILRNRNQGFEEQIVAVTSNIYTAVGYSVSNSSMIVGNDGVIIVDTGLDPERGKNILAKFREISDKPIKAIILTHSHRDHIGGITSFMESGNVSSDLKIWATPNFGAENSRLANLRKIRMMRGIRQAGFKLPDDQRINNGIAPAHQILAQAPPLDPQKLSRMSPPRESLEIAGIKLELVAAPGETNDQLYIWLPEQKVLFSADNFYESFPSLAPIRGNPYRNVSAWVNSLDAMLAEQPAYLIPGHTQPIIGQSQIAEALTDYRDAVRFIYDKTIEGINQGLTPDQLVDYVQLPDELAQKEYLKPFYGHPDWGVRSIFAGYLGWFDGNPTNLFPLSPTEEAQHIADLAGGPNKLLDAATTALAQENYQWAAQLSDYLLALDNQASLPKRIKATALMNLGQQSITTTARNYYLTSAQELNPNVFADAKRRRLLQQR